MIRVFAALWLSASIVGAQEAGKTVEVLLQIRGVRRGEAGETPISRGQKVKVLRREGPFLVIEWQGKEWSTDRKTLLRAIGQEDKAAIEDLLATLEQVQKANVAPACPPAAPRKVETPDVVTPSPLVAAARATIAGFFGSCDAADVVLSEIPDTSDSLDVLKHQTRVLKTGFEDTYRKQNPFIQAVLNDRKASDECKDKCSRPSVYVNGAKPSVSNDRLILSNRQTAGAGGATTSSLDCSGFICAVMAKAGLRFTTQQEEREKGTAEFDKRHPATTSLGTGHITSLAQPQYQSCFDTPSLSDSRSLRPGDILTKNQDHVVMIDSVSNPPFVMPDSRDEKGCEAASVNPKNYQFIISQSASAGGLGVQRVKASAYFAHIRRTSFFRSIASIYNEVCLNQKSDGKLGTYFAVLRHRSTDPACVTKPMRTDSDACIKGCDNV